MQQARGDSPVKSAAPLNAMPMPSFVSTSLRDSLDASFTLGRAISVTVLLLASAKASLPTVAESGSWHPEPPAGGSAAIMVSRPPR
jgi:hypothetical protein